MMFSNDDVAYLESKGIQPQIVADQIETFKKGIQAVRLHEAAIVGNGIRRFSNDEIDNLIDTYEKFNGTVGKFVPASGAASRMFKHLFEFKSAFDGSESQYDQLVAEKGIVWDFFKRLEDFAFYPALKSAFEQINGTSIEEAHLKRDYGLILDTFLHAPGLNYGSLPKGLITFHRSGDNYRIAAHEQIVEGLGYAVKGEKLNLHFTVSPEHQHMFEETLNRIKKQITSVRVHISYSIQKPSTDTIAVDPNNQPFRGDSGTLLFRPAGHGALLENLNELDDEVIFIKNIDNVVPDRLKDETIRFKKVLAGTVIHYQQKAFDLLKRHDAGKDITIEARKLLEEMGVRGFENDEIIKLLNRPIRACGMVKNAGEPGGGPFWVNKNGKYNLQIVEGAQVDKSDEDQSKILAKSTHFNPVDIVCAVYNYQGEKFNLLDYRDPDTGFITEKSSGGKTLKAMELPGLWNGSMAYWNTIFVEVPLITFNPVKTVNDLLRPEHQ